MHLFFLIILFVSHIFVVRLDAEVYKIESLSEIVIDDSVQTIYLIDLDDTIFDFPHMLGSKAWRRYIAKVTKKMDRTANWHDIFSYDLALKGRVEAVEQFTPAFIASLRSKGHLVYGLTARERNQWYDTPQTGVDELTIAQLNSIGVEFDDHNMNAELDWLTDVPQFYRGVLFADSEPKGKFLESLLQLASVRPNKIVFIDDKESQVQSVARVLEQMNIENACYLYTATDQKARAFDPRIANRQLVYFYLSQFEELLSDQSAREIVEEFPEATARICLEAAIEMAKKRSFLGRKATAGR